MVKVRDTRSPLGSVCHGWIESRLYRPSPPARTHTTYFDTRRAAQLPNTLFFHMTWHLMRIGSARRHLLTVKNLLLAPGGPRWGCDVGCTCNRGASACSGLGCHTLPTLTPCLLSPSVAGGGAPGHALYALQPLDDKVLCACPTGWHGLCYLRERRLDGELGGGRHSDRSPMRHVAPGNTVNR